MVFKKYIVTTKKQEAAGTLTTLEKHWGLN